MVLSESSIRGASRLLVRSKATAGRTNLPTRLPQSCQQCARSIFTSSPEYYAEPSSSASAMSAGASKQVKSAAQALLPPIQLLRRLLRAHRDKLSPEMRSLGDNYVKDEFKRHQKIDNPLHIVGFLSQWKLYLDALEQGDTGEAGEGESHIDAASKRYFRGKRLDPETMEKLSEEQLYQLYELMQATKEMYDPEKAQAKPPNMK